MTSLQSSLAASESRLAERVAEFSAQVLSLEEKVQNVEKDRDMALSTLEKIHVSNKLVFRTPCSICSTLVQVRIKNSINSMFVFVIYRSVLVSLLSLFFLSICELYCTVGRSY